MKECPICHTQYDDSLNFCTKDGHQLRSVETTTVETPKTEVKSDIHSKGNKGCLKKVVIGIIIIIVGLVFLYNYLSNAATYLRTEPSEVHASKAGETCKVDIDYDGYIWTVNHQPEWVDISENDNDFELIVTPNHTGQLREGSITVQSGKLLSQVVVKQNAYATLIKASETAVKFSKSGGNKDITIESDGCSWDAEHTDWIIVRKINETKLHLKCKKNDGEFRTGSITVKEDNTRTRINITQGGDCNNCHGSGEVSCNSCFGMGGMDFGYYYSRCIWCGGSGKIPCSVCKGTGVRE